MRVRPLPSVAGSLKQVQMRGGARSAAREAYFEYVERAAEGANEADGPVSATRLQAFD